MLDLSKLRKIKRNSSGGVIAECPVCAAAGNDHSGNHLKIDAKGRFSCVVNPGRDGNFHRKEIFRIAGLPENDNKVKVPPTLVWGLRRVTA